MDENNPLLQRVIIDIDPETGDYSADFQVCDKDTVIKALENLLARISDEDLLAQTGLKVTREDF